MASTNSLLSVLFTFGLMLLTVKSADQSKSAKSFVKLRLIRSTHVEELHKLNEAGSIRGLPDRLKVNSSVLGEIDNSDLSLLLSKGFEATPINISDFTSRSFAFSPSRISYHGRSLPFFNSYSRYGEIIGFMNSLTSKYPKLISMENIGRSFEGRDLRLFKIGTNHRSETKPILWIDAGIHAREWIAPATALFIAHQLVNDYSKDPVTKALVDTFDWYIFPMVNPDGYEYSHTNSRMWRKTRSRHRSMGGDCVGVDANRNFDFHWMESGSTSYPCSDIYAGPKPFSEPETIAMKNTILKKRHRIKLYVSFHSYAQQWLYPWGYAAVFPSNMEELHKKAMVALEGIKSKYGTVYEAGSSGKMLYPASGGSDDWALGIAGIPYSYTVELRPRDSDSLNGFILPADQIVPTGEETWLGLQKLAAELRKDLARIKS